MRQPTGDCPVVQLIFSVNNVLAKFTKKGIFFILVKYGGGGGGG